MKKNKALSRVYLGGYFVWIFGSFLAPLVLNYYGAAPSIITIVLVVADLAAIICSHVFYSKLKQAYLPTSFAAFGVLNVLVLLGFIFEIVLTVKGKPAVWPWILGVICVLLLIPIDYFLIRCNLKYRKQLQDEAALLASEVKPEEPAQEETAE